MLSLIVIIFFSGTKTIFKPESRTNSSTTGFDIFFPGNFTASGFLSNYINVLVFAGLYIFFRLFFYKSSIIPLEEINMADEFNKIEEEKAAMVETDSSSR